MQASAVLTPASPRMRWRARIRRHDLWFPYLNDCGDEQSIHGAVCFYTGRGLTWSQRRLCGCWMSSVAEEHKKSKEREERNKKKGRKKRTRRSTSLCSYHLSHLLSTLLWAVFLCYLCIYGDGLCLSYASIFLLPVLPYIFSSVVLFYILYQGYLWFHLIFHRYQYLSRFYFSLGSGHVHIHAIYFDFVRHHVWAAIASSGEERLLLQNGIIY